MPNIERLPIAGEPSRLPQHLLQALGQVLKNGSVWVTPEKDYSTPLQITGQAVVTTDADTRGTPSQLEGYTLSGRELTGSLNSTLTTGTLTIVGRAILQNVTVDGGTLFDTLAQADVNTGTVTLAQLATAFNTLLANLRATRVLTP